MLSIARKVPLRNHRDFFQVARRKRVSFASLFYLPQEKTQFSVLVSKKTAALASKRNAVKRTIYRALSLEWERLRPLKLGVVIAVYARADQVDEQFANQLIRECLALQSNEKNTQT